MVGLDFNSLEDYISALTTRDPNKLRVYEDGFCGHCLRAAYYFRDQLPHIDLDDPVSVNSIKKTHPHLRQDSKPYTFAATYGGTWITFVNNLGCPEDKAKEIEANYHKLYAVSDKWVRDKLIQATHDGYVTVAFGLRVRTPMLAQVVLGTSKTPYEAEAEGRTAGNALGQSWGLLNSRASMEFMDKVRVSAYRLSIRPAAHIHDAQYMYVRDTIETLAWVNKHLVQAVQWQEDPLIAHDTVKIGGELSIFYPSWKYETVVPNYADATEIHAVCVKEAQERNG